MTVKKHRGLLLALTALALVLAAGAFTGCDPALLWSRGDHLTDILRQMVPPDWAYFPKVLSPLWATVQMSVTGTALGALLALALAPLCAAGLRVNGPLRLLLRALVIVVMIAQFFNENYENVFLCLLTLVLFILPAFIQVNYAIKLPNTLEVIIFLFIFAAEILGEIQAYTFAIMTRLTCDDIESSSLAAYEALVCMGAPSYRAFFRGVFPGLAPTYLTNVLYLLETNVRHSAILGYVGAGGVGLLLNEKISWREYDRVGAILLALFLAVCLIEALSAYLTALITGRKKPGPDCAGPSWRWI